jgi:DNA polymerase-3 subunit epsilon
LTGISNEMVADAPPFADLASETLRRLHGRLFIAHNARFDYGFLKNEFKRLGIDFRSACDLYRQAVAGPCFPNTSATTSTA